MTRGRLLSMLALGLCPAVAVAHVMQVPYNLPVPFWLYAYGATGALLASFLVVGFFVRADAGQRAFGTIPVGGCLAAALTSRGVVGFFRILAVVLLLISIATGLLGSRQPMRNFNVTFFWVVFVLGFTYLTAIVGDVFRAINPWLVLCEWIEAARPASLKARIAYPPWLAYYPALVLYMAFIWIELFGRTNPFNLSLVLLGYTVVTLAAAWLVGKDTWFHYGEFFAVFFRLIGKMSPLDYRCGDDSGGRAQLRARAPFIGLLTEHADHMSLLLFVLFMLSSTAYDGIHETVPWVGIFWKQIYPVLAQYIAAGGPGQYLILVDYFYYWQWLMMLLSPFVYLAIYLVFIALAKLATRSPMTVRELALQFAFSLIPIAFVYNVTHYFTLAIAQGPSIVNLMSDPLGNGWDLLGTKTWYAQPIMLDAGVIWHTQVGLILFGHILSVYLAHVEALKLFSTNRQAALSQVPLLLLMVLLTTIGLWILSLPIAAGQVLLPPPPGA